MPASRPLAWYLLSLRAVGDHDGLRRAAARHGGELVALSPWRLLAGAARVYVMSSQLGYEAMLAGHRPRIFGRPFYAGWGLSEDQHRLPRRRPAGIGQLFHCARVSIR